MDFLIKMRDTVRGWSEEARVFLAFAIMGVALISFFSLWVTGASSRLVAVKSGDSSGSASALPSPVAFAPPDAGAGLGAGGAGVTDVAPPYKYNIPAPLSPARATDGGMGPALPSAADLPPTPVQGVAETFGGLRQLFSTGDTDRASGAAVSIADRLYAVRAWLWDLALALFDVVQNFLVWLGGWLYTRASTFIAS
jgi:hypothetical protein